MADHKAGISGNLATSSVDVPEKPASLRCPYQPLSHNYGNLHSCTAISSHLPSIHIRASQLAQYTRTRTHAHTHMRTPLIGNCHGSALRGQEKKKHTNIPSRETHKSTEEEWGLGGGMWFLRREAKMRCSQPCADWCVSAARGGRGIS